MASDPDDDFLYSTDDDHEPDPGWRRGFTSMPQAVSGKYPYFMVRCSSLLRRQTALVARQHGYSREEWIRLTLGKRISEETGIGIDELMAGGPATIKPKGAV